LTAYTWLWLIDDNIRAGGDDYCESVVVDASIQTGEEETHTGTFHEVSVNVDETHRYRTAFCVGNGILSWQRVWLGPSPSTFCQAGQDLASTKILFLQKVYALH